MSAHLASLSWNPIIGLPEAVALALVFAGLGLWLAWRCNGEAPSRLRATLTALRGAGLIFLCILWLNPGRWLDHTEEIQRDWLVLLDRSASMQAEHAASQSRWDAALKAAETLGKASGAAGEVRIQPFAGQLEAETASPRMLAPDGTASDPARSIATALEQRGIALAGLIIISDGRSTAPVADGRSTAPASTEEVALRARARGVPIHAIALGAAWGSRDLVLTARPRHVTAFKGQPVKISVELENRGLGAIRPRVILSAPDGAELAAQDAAIEDGSRANVVFELPHVPETGGEFIVRTAPWPGEHLPANNSDAVRVTVLKSRTRVLLLEGAPYWDSKFLAQLLRNQQSIEILTVHRLNEERYFRVEATGAEPLLSPDAVFPPSAAELARYDLIVFGKGSDGFLDAARIEALQGFVRDQGGAVLFARGKPYTGKFPALQSLGFAFTPLADAGAALFGAALPAAGDGIWQSLPPLDDVHAVARVRPFARVLAEGAPEGRQARVPLLVARRYGRGMCATVNADGLWRWDFRADARDATGLYQQFWVQLMQWCATYSEFRPGEDYAVRLRESTTATGQPVRAIIAYRGPAQPEPRPLLKVYRGSELTAEVLATALPGADGGREWAAVVAPAEPGRYSVRVADPARPGEEGEARLEALAPLKESDDLRPDAEALATLARISGGRVVEAEKAGALADSLWKADPATALAKPEWRSLWPQPWVAMLVALAFGAEWWLRRREGLL
jgi:hypothetical protein